MKNFLGTLLSIVFVIGYLYSQNKDDIDKWISNKNEKETTYKEEPMKLPNFQPKVPQEVIDLAINRVKAKVNCQKKYEILNYTTSVSVDLKYNIWIKVIEPCDEIAKELWIQYEEYENGEYACTKDVFVNRN
ncbi:hypothetical protein [Dysgonomonas reticulitermitis]